MLLQSRPQQYKQMSAGHVVRGAGSNELQQPVSVQATAEGPEASK